MPRYRYIKAEFNIPEIGMLWVPVPRIETGIQILEAVGEGKLCLTGRSVKTPRFKIAPKPRLSIEELQGLDKDATRRLFDRESDIECVARNTAERSTRSIFPMSL